MTALSESWSRNIGWLDAVPDDEVNRRCDRLEAREIVDSPEMLAHLKPYQSINCDDLPFDEADYR